MNPPLIKKAEVFPEKIFMGHQFHYKVPISQCPFILDLYLRVTILAYHFWGDTNMKRYISYQSAMNKRQCSALNGKSVMNLHI